jgi:hypothetical protein
VASVFYNFKVIFLLSPSGKIHNSLFYSAFGKSMCTYKRCWKWCPRACIQAWTRLILFANTFCTSAFGKSLWTYKRCWKWCTRACIQAWTRLILFANTFCRSAFGKSLCIYKRCRKRCRRSSIQAWTRLISLANTFCRSVCEIFLIYAVIAVFSSLSLLRYWQTNLRTVA